MDLRQIGLPSDTEAVTFYHRGETESSTTGVVTPPPSSKRLNKRPYEEFRPRPTNYLERAEDAVFGDESSDRNEPEPLDLSVKAPSKRKLSLSGSLEEDQEEEEEGIPAKRKRESVICYACDPSDPYVVSTESADDHFKQALGIYIYSVFYEVSPKLQEREAYGPKARMGPAPRALPHSPCYEKDEFSIELEVDKHFIRSLGLATWMKLQGLG